MIPVTKTRNMRTMKRTATVLASLLPADVTAETASSSTTSGELLCCPNIWTFVRAMRLWLHVHRSSCLDLICRRSPSSSVVLSSNNRLSNATDIHVEVGYTSSSSRARFNVPPNTLYVISGTDFIGQKTQPTVSKHWRKRSPRTGLQSH